MKIAAPKWKPVIDQFMAVLGSMQDDEVITFDKLSEVFGQPVDSNTYPLRKALERLEKECQIRFMSQRGVGYIRTSAVLNQTVDARKQFLKVHRAGKRSLRRSFCADEDQLPPSLKPTKWARESALSNIISVTHAGVLKKNVDRAKSILADENKTFLAAIKSKK
jgi:hypothetical protein